MFDEREEWREARDGLISEVTRLGFDEALKEETHNFVEADAAEAAKNGTLKALVDRHFGE